MTPERKKYPTFMDETCILFDEIAVSAGERGHQMILPPEPLVELIGGTTDDLCK
jgi:Cys-tRNA(Pro)/Cys-tRNA(Cys) deacylase